MVFLQLYQRSYLAIMGLGVQTLDECSGRVSHKNVHHFHQATANVVGYRRYGDPPGPRRVWVSEPRTGPGPNVKARVDG